MVDVYKVDFTFDLVACKRTIKNKRHLPDWFQAIEQQIRPFGFVFVHVEDYGDDYLFGIFPIATATSLVGLKLPEYRLIDNDEFCKE